MANLSSFLHNTECVERTGPVASGCHGTQDTALRKCDGWAARIHACLGVWVLHRLVLPSPGSILFSFQKKKGGFPGGTVVNNLPANAGDTGSSPGPGRPHMPRSN